MVIPKWKVLIEISRYVDEIEEWEEKSLKSGETEWPEVGEVKITDMTLSQLNTLMSAYQVAIHVPYEIDSFLLYWLKRLGIEYEVISEFDLEKRKDLKEFKILRRW